MAKLNPSVRPADRARLSAQQGAILDLLIARPRTAMELSQTALNYRARISELRQAGHIVDCDHKKGGRTVYTYRGWHPSPQLLLIEANR